MTDKHITYNVISAIEVEMKDSLITYKITEIYKHVVKSFILVSE